MNVHRKTRVGVVGATGYAGAELVRILMEHPYVEISYLAASADSGSLISTYPNLLGSPLPPVLAFDTESCASLCDVVFVALPSGKSGHIAADLWSMGLKVIDLSGDLRLPSEIYEAWYPHKAPSSDAISQAVYGLTEWAGDKVPSASLVANPGCYATAVLLGLMPLEKPGWLAGKTVYVDAKSGISGAGKSAKVDYLFTELDDNFMAYKLGRHQHTPEIEQMLHNQTKVLLTTQLLPTIRGIFASMYIPLSEGMDDERVQGIFSESYKDKPFVQVVGAVSPQLKAVRGGNACHIGWHVDYRTETLVVMSAIDNLQKGAAGQAVQNFNRMYGYEETFGLHTLGVFP